MLRVLVVRRMMPKSQSGVTKKAGKLTPARVVLPRGQAKQFGTKLADTSFRDKREAKCNHANQNNAHTTC